MALPGARALVRGSTTTHLALSDVLGELLVGRLETLRFALARRGAARGLADGAVDDVGALVLGHVGREKRGPALVIAHVCRLVVSGERPGPRIALARVLVRLARRSHRPGNACPR